MIEAMTEWMKSVDAVLTSIDAPIEDIKDEVYYDLSGNRIKEPKRGIYIKKGRKFFVK